MVDSLEHVQALLEKLERLQMALAASGMGTFVWYPRDDRMDADPRMLSLLGQSVGAVLSLRALPEILHSDDRERYRRALERACDGNGNGELNEELRLSLGSAPPLWIALRGRMFFDKDGRPVRMVGSAQDMTARGEADRRRNFLLRLAEALRLVIEPRDILRTTLQLLGIHLGLGRALFAEIERMPDSDYYTVIEDYHSPDEPSLRGRYRAEDFSSQRSKEGDAGRTLVVPDVRQQTSLGGERKRYLDIGIYAFVAVPLVRDGRQVAVLGAYQGAPRAWSTREINLMQEIGDLTWASVERARRR